MNSIQSTYLGGAHNYIWESKTFIWFICKLLSGLSSITKKGEIESASRPQMGFGELNDNMIKGLTLYLRYHEQGFLCVLFYILTHVSRNQIKENSLLKVKHVVTRNEKQVFMKCWYMVSIHGLTNLENIWDIKLLKVLLQGFMELSKKRRHALMCYRLVLYMEACNAWNMVIIHDY